MDGLYFYGARWYDDARQILSADTIIPQPGNPLAWDRYAYVLNNALKYIDPSGHDPYCGSKSKYKWNVDCSGGEATWPTYSGNFRHPLNDPFYQSGFGYGDDNDTNGGHQGIDLTNQDRKVIASGNGVVAINDPCDLDDCEGIMDTDNPETNFGYGNLLVVEYPYSVLPDDTRDGLGLESGQSLYLLYAHLEKPSNVKAGDFVSTDMTIGIIGNTGYSTGVHVHFAAKVGTSRALRFSKYGGDTQKHWLSLGPINPNDIVYVTTIERATSMNGLGVK